MSIGVETSEPIKLRNSKVQDIASLVFFLAFFLLVMYFIQINIC